MPSLPTEKPLAAFGDENGIVEEQRIIYLCPHCGEHWLTHAAAFRHVVDQGCFHDPETEHCLTCAYLVKGKEKGDRLACRAGIHIMKPWAEHIHCPAWIFGEDPRHR